MESDNVLMGTWPEPLTGNRQIGVVGPLADDGGINTERQAFGATTGGNQILDEGSSYYFPFQSTEYFTPLAIGITHGKDTFTGTSLVSIRVAIYAEAGDGYAIQESITPWHATLSQTSDYNEHVLSPQVMLPPGGYYVGFEIDFVSGSTLSTTVYLSTAQHLHRVLGHRMATTPLNSSVTFTPYSSGGTPSGLIADMFVIAMAGV
jgi:hypothetical protein